MTTKGALFVVATPIGNMDDLTLRAIEVLRQVDHVLAEDTRRTQGLMRRHVINTPLSALHDHNERARVESIARRLETGESIALVSDAGTPLISDPGFRLVRELRERSLQVIPIPGACAAIAALSVAGLPTDRFVFEGFLPAKSGARQERINDLVREPRTMVFYESPHRLSALVDDLHASFGPERQAVLGRELTKLHEEVFSGTLGSLREAVERGEVAARGEIVLLLAGAPATESPIALQTDEILDALLEDLPVKRAAALTARLTGGKRNEIYKRALARHQAREME